MKTYFSYIVIISIYQTILSIQNAQILNYHKLASEKSIVCYYETNYPIILPFTFLYTSYSIFALTHTVHIHFYKRFLTTLYSQVPNKCPHVS